MVDANPQSADGPSNFKTFEAREYCTEYYSSIIEDERLCLEFLVESLAKLPETQMAIDFGCGPVVSHLLPLAAKARQIHAAEFLESNRVEVEKWLKGHPDAGDWREFSLEILRIQGETPTAQRAEAMERQLRERLSEVSFCDITRSDPMGPSRRAAYGLVTSHYCAEGLGVDVETWRVYMQNMMSLVAPGGALIVTSCGSTIPTGSGDFFRIGSEQFPLTSIMPGQFLAAFQDNGFLDIDLRVRKLRESVNQGFDCLLFACAIKTPDMKPAVDAARAPS